jgi:hypothetical protein
MMMDVLQDMNQTIGRIKILGDDEGDRVKHSFMLE